MKTVTVCLTVFSFLVLPVLILVYDAFVNFYGDHGDTITGVVREWAKRSSWPLFVYVVGTVVLGLHLFFGWPDDITD